MGYQFPPDVESLVRARMASGKYPSEDDLLREALLSLQEEEEDVEALREAIAEYHAGDPGVALDEAIAHLRAKGNAAPDQ